MDELFLEIYGGRVHGVKSLLSVIHQPREMWRSHVRTLALGCPTLATNVLTRFCFVSSGRGHTFLRARRS